jgi:hypothetical protein
MISPSPGLQVVAAGWRTADCLGPLPDYSGSLSQGFRRWSARLSAVPLAGSAHNAPCVMPTSSDAALMAPACLATCFAHGCIQACAQARSAECCMHAIYRPSRPRFCCVKTVQATNWPVAVDWPQSGLSRGAGHKAACGEGQVTKWPAEKGRPQSGLLIATGCRSACHTRQAATKPAEHDQPQSGPPHLASRREASRRVGNQLVSRASGRCCLQRLHDAKLALLAMATAPATCSTACTEYVV